MYRDSSLHGPNSAFGAKDMQPKRKFCWLTNERSSSKINYDVLKKLLDDEPEEVPGKVEESKHSNANYADSQQVDENSIPEGHSSGASEENDEHEHDYGETDAGNNVNYNDMYFENEENSIPYFFC
ncbi:hypothetical protein NC652_000927 [Populus alba x Populus x berolinensis]|nr:hypothetical protein NC652_000927 [Populus alba x Populus x berolinensis]